MNGHETGDRVRSPASYRLNDSGYGCKARRVVSDIHSNRGITRRVSDLCELHVTVAAEVLTTPSLSNLFNPGLESNMQSLGYDKRKEKALQIPA